MTIKCYLCKITTNSWSNNEAYAAWGRNLIHPTIVVEGPKPATRGGMNGSRSKFLRNSNRRPMSQNHPSPQAFWPKFGVAIEKLNQHKRPRTCERNHEANRKRIERNRRTDLPGPVWPVHWTGLTGLGCSKTSWPVLPTGLTGGTQKTPENMDSNYESQPNDHKNRWKLGDSFAPTHEHIP